MAWGSSFDKPTYPGEVEFEPDGPVTVSWFEEAAPVAWPEPKKVYTALEQIADEKFKYAENVLVEHKPITLAQAIERTNKVPTHDPYTNPNATIYYECNCGQILDPGTKRFAELNNCASKAGWKIRFSDSGYTPYCVECGKGVE